MSARPLGERLKSVRLDRGDIAAVSKEVRHLRTEAGLDYVTILASGGIDEFKIAQILAAGGEVDSFAVGTKMGVAADACNPRNPGAGVRRKLIRYGNYGNSL